MEFTPLIDIPLIHPGDDLINIIINGMKSTKLILKENDIFVIAQKIVSKSEGRYKDLNRIKPSLKALELSEQIHKDARLIELILKESKCILRMKPGTLIVEHKLGFVCANAGIDHSNVDSSGDKMKDLYLLLPKNPDRSARIIRKQIKNNYNVNVGISIIDTHGRAWRNGIVGITIGISGIPGVIDLRGTPDLFGYRLNVTQLAVADELAAGASLVMGQASEKTPIIHVRGFPYILREGGMKELIRPKGEDLFR